MPPIAWMLVCWFLFVFPALIAAFSVLAAWLYYCGTRQQSPGIGAPRFSFTRKKQDNGHATVDRLPEV